MFTMRKNFHNTPLIEILVKDHKYRDILLSLPSVNHLLDNPLEVGALSASQM